LGIVAAALIVLSLRDSFAVVLSWCGSWIRSVAVAGAQVVPRALASLPEPQHYPDAPRFGYCGATPYLVHTPLPSFRSCSAWWLDLMSAVVSCSFSPSWFIHLT